MLESYFERLCTFC